MQKNSFARILSLAAISLGCSFPMLAQSQIKTEAIGRLHVDAATYAPLKYGFESGAAVSELRAGAKCTVDDWMARIEIGYNYGKIGLKDVYIQRSLSPNSYFRTGYFIPEFGIRGAGSASYKPAMQPMVSESFFRTMTRKIGVLYDYAFQDGAVSASAFVGGRSMTLNATEQGKVSVGGCVRSVWHPICEDGNLIQLGVSAFYETASHTASDGAGGETVSPGFRKYSAKFPTQVSSVPMLEADVKKAKGDYKFSPELILSAGPLAIESQYFFMTVPRTDGFKPYQAEGAFGIVRWLVKGDREYCFNRSASNLKDPKAGSVELVAAFDYTNANLGKSEIKGGISNELSLCANYYINQCLTARLCYTYATVADSPRPEPSCANILQARLQFVF